MMRKKSSAQKTIRDIRRVTRRHYSAEEKIRIVLEGLRGEDSTAEYFGMTEKALRAIEERQPKVFTAYRKGKARAIANAGSALMPGIKRGDVRAIQFYLKTQAGWSEKNALELPAAPVEDDKTWTINVIEPD